MIVPNELISNSNESSNSVQLLHAIQQCDVTKVNELLPLLQTENINARFGPLQISYLEFAASISLNKTLSVLELLISYGATIQGSDKLGRTALHYAAGNGNFEIVKLLLNNGAIIDAKYELNSLRDTQISEDYGISKFLPLPECWGRTALHEAVRKNHKKVVKILLESGASVNIKDEHKITPLLLAGANVQRETMADYEEIISMLISYKADVNSYNKCTGATALHHAVSLNNLTATELLLKAGATLKSGGCGQTPIHDAASKGNDTILSLLLQYEDFTVNRPDNNGSTALHKAAFASSRECLKLLINHGGDISLRTKSQISVIDVIFSHIPRPLHFMNDIFNSKITCNDVSLNDIDFKLTLDFNLLCPKNSIHQMTVIEAILNAGNDNQSLELLQHPLIETFLHLKWRKLRFFFILLVLLHFVFVISLSLYVILIVHRPGWAEFLIELSRHILLLSALVLFAHACIQCLLVPRHYFKQYEMWLNMLCALLSFIIALAGNQSTETTVNGKLIKVPDDWVLHIMSLIILLAWIELMLLIGRFPAYGYYALMFSTVLQNVIKVLLTFICLVIGFALSFSIQFHSNEQFTDPWRSVVKTVVMMMGEYEYTDLFSDSKVDKVSNDLARLSATSRIIFILFIILSSIVLMNLMIGLAVNDIQGLQKEGHAKRLSKQAIFLSHLEKILSHKLFKSDWFPSEIFHILYMRRNIKALLVLKPGRKIINKETDLENTFFKCIPSKILESIINIATSHVNVISEPDTNNSNLVEILLTLKDIEKKLQKIICKH